jgi:hypothetical protein
MLPLIMAAARHSGSVAVPLQRHPSWVPGRRRCLREGQARGLLLRVIAAAPLGTHGGGSTLCNKKNSNGIQPNGKRQTAKIKVRSSAELAARPANCRFPNLPHRNSRAMFAAYYRVCGAPKPHAAGRAAGPQSGSCATYFEIAPRKKEIF